MLRVTTQHPQVINTMCATEKTALAKTIY